MTITRIILLAVGLAMDAFAVSVAIGLSHKVRPRDVIRATLYFGLFQAGMTAAGFFAGQTVEGLLGDFTPWLAFALLALIGGKMFAEAIRGEELPNPRKTKDPTRGWTLLMLAVATSIDALAAGISLAFIQDDILQPAILIGAVTMLLCMLGMRFGNHLSKRFEKVAEILGGLVLIGIGVNILIHHLMG